MAAAKKITENTAAQKSANEENNSLQIVNPQEIEAQEEENSSVSVDIDKSVFENAMNQLTRIKTLKVGIEITAEYFKMQEGEEVRAIFCGFQRITATKGVNAANTRIGEDGKIAAAKFILEPEKEGLKPRTVIMADAVIVSAFENIGVMQAVCITCKGKKEGKAGTYKDYSIEYLY